MLFLAWLAAAFVVVGAINLYLRYFGLPRNTTNTTPTGTVYSSPGSTLTTGTGAGSEKTGWLSGGQGYAGGGETLNWFTASIAWMHQRCTQTPDFVDAWLRALSLEADRQQHLLQNPSGNQIQVRFDGVHGAAPEFSNVKVDTSSNQQLTLYGMLTGRDTTLQLCCLSRTSAPPSSISTSPNISSQSAPSSETVNCDTRIHWIKGQIRLIIKLINNELSLNISFVQAPELKLQTRSARTNAPIDMSLVENTVRAAIGGATTNISWMSRPTSSQSGAYVGPQGRPAAGDFSALHDRNIIPQMRQQHLYATQDTTHIKDPTVPPTTQLQANYQSPLLQQGMGAGVQTRDQTGLGSSLVTDSPLQPTTATLAYSGRPAEQGVQQYMSQPKLQKGADNRPMKSLLVKVIKANGLVDTDWGSCNAYCLLRLDQPPQSYMTNVIRNTVNPLWDEQFVFNISDDTKWIQFEVLDRDKQPDNDLLGKAVVVLDEIRRMPSSRQIIPLTGRPRSRTSTSGSVTVELIFLDTLETAGATGPVTAHQYNTPTNQQQGVLQDNRSGQYSDPNKLRMNTSSDYGPTRGRMDGQGAVYGGEQDGTGNSLSAHDLALTGSHPGSQTRPQDSPSLVVTGAEAQRINSYQQQVGPGGRTNIDYKPKKKKVPTATLR